MEVCVTVLLRSYSYLLYFTVPNMSYNTQKYECSCLAQNEANSTAYSKCMLQYRVLLFFFIIYSTVLVYTDTSIHITGYTKVLCMCVQHPVHISSGYTELSRRTLTPCLRSVGFLYILCERERGTFLYLNLKI